MTVYLADCSPYWYLWGDTHEEAEMLALLVGHGMAQAPWSWGCFALSQEEATMALALGATLTDRFGPAEWIAVRDNKPSMVATIQKARLHGAAG